MVAEAISIVVPTFNRCHTIERCLNSILKQDYPSQRIEIIVVDDGSNDNTLGILRHYQHAHNIRVFRQENRGVSAARNLGLKHARNSWIAFLDSDDYWMPKKLKCQIKLLKKKNVLSAIQRKYGYGMAKELINVNITGNMADILSKKTYHCVP